MLVKPEQKPGYAELMIDTTSSRICTKPTVTCSTFSQAATSPENEAFSITLLRFVSTQSYSVFANRKAVEAEMLSLQFGFLDQMKFAQ